MHEILLVVVALAVGVIGYGVAHSIQTFKEILMASVQEVADAVVAASVSVKALADAYAAKAAGIDPASLDPVLAAANQLKAVADAAVNPPAPGA